MNITLPYEEWQGLLEQREKLKATIAEKDAEIQRLKNMFRRLRRAIPTDLDQDDPELDFMNFRDMVESIVTQALEVNHE